MFKLILKIPGMASVCRAVYHYRNPALEQEIFGLTFPNPVGLAAGFDKNAEFLRELATLGFGFMETGTITPKPQPGNPKPRLFRLKKDHALINRMGFNSKGLNYAEQRLKNRPEGLTVGVNIGKNKATPNEKAENDYLTCLHRLHDLTDYFTVNVSSPNTPKLTELQQKKPLENLLRALTEANHKKAKPKPILLKISPDLTDSELDDIIDLLSKIKIDGIIAANTTGSREGLRASESDIQAIGNGGLSGKPLRERSTEIIRYIRSRNASIPIIAAGGITDEQSALEKWDAGANLLQVYTGFVFEGPALIKRINRAILGRLEEGQPIR